MRQLPDQLQAKVTSGSADEGGSVPAPTENTGIRLLFREGWRWLVYRIIRPDGMAPQPRSASAAPTSQQRGEARCSEAATRTSTDGEDGLQRRSTSETGRQLPEQALPMQRMLP